MKILHISTFDTGGAAKACIRIHLGLLAKGYDSSLLTLYKNTDTLPNHYLYQSSSNFFTKSYKSILYKQKEKNHKKFLENKPNSSSQFTFPDSVYDITDSLVYQEADIIHLHWVAKFLDYKSFFKKNRKKVVWTPHDMNPFTGGCHYSLQCNLFTKDCQLCPQLIGTNNPEITFNLLKLKLRSINRSKNTITAVYLSNWMLECGTASTLFKNIKYAIIPNSVDTNVFKPLDQAQARISLGLPLDKKIVFFVSDDIENKLKGFDLLIESLNYFKNSNDLMLLTVGKYNSCITELNIPHKHLGYISAEEELAIAYNASDVLINPSLAESFSLVTLEAMACGIPVVAFRIGGLKDLVKENETGLLADSGNINDFVRKITVLLDNSYSQRKRMGIEARKIAETKYDNKIQIEKYIELYNQLILS